MERFTIRTLPHVDFPTFSPRHAAPFRPARDSALSAFLQAEINLLKIPLTAIRDDLGKFQIPVDDPPTRWKPAKKITAAALSQWLAGKDPWPVYRLAALCCLVEVRFLELVAKGRAPDTMSGLDALLTLAKDHHTRVMDLPELSPLLTAYRCSIFQRLQRDRGKSPDHAKLFAEFKAAMPHELVDMLAQRKGQ